MILHQMEMNPMCIGHVIDKNGAFLSHASRIQLQWYACLEHSSLFKGVSGEKMAKVYQTMCFCNNHGTMGDMVESRELSIDNNSKVHQ